MEAKTNKILGQCMVQRQAKENGGSETSVQRSS